MSLMIDRYRSKPVWPSRYAALLHKSVSRGLTTHQDALADRGSMFRALYKRRPKPARTRSETR